MRARLGSWLDGVLRRDAPRGRGSRVVRTMQFGLEPSFAAS